MFVQNGRLSAMLRSALYFAVCLGAAPYDQRSCWRLDPVSMIASGKQLSTVAVVTQAQLVDILSSSLIS